MRQSFPFTFILCTLFMPIVVAQTLPVPTGSDSARFYYYEGWRQVLDEGNYTASETAYRHMMKYDPDFLLGLSLVGRISRDSLERLSIEARLMSQKTDTGRDEDRLLELFIDLVRLTNLRRSNPEKAGEFANEVFTKGEKTLLMIAHRYPSDYYYKCEYIEVLHRNHGPRLALDSLAILADDDQKGRPFLLGYAAGMEAELGNFGKAFQLAASLSDQFTGKKSPKPLVVYADLYFKMKKTEAARQYVTEALTIEPGNIDAQRLKARIDKEK
jgi:tetratricopeptide (TPR) repeat protein